MTQNAPPSADPAPTFNTTLPTTPPTEKKEPTSPRMSNPATKAGVDPLAGVMPCFNESCEAPQGDFENRAKLESLLKQSDGGGEGGGAEESSGEGLTDAIREAVDIAVVSCFFFPSHHHQPLSYHTRVTHVTAVFVFSFGPAVGVLPKVANFIFSLWSYIHMNT